MRRCDLAIVGGGPAGLATALAAARRGLDAVVLERSTGPVDKACGEGLMPPGVARLRQLGVELPEAAVHPLRGVRYVEGDVQVCADFAEEGGGLGVRRLVLSEALRARVRAVGVELREGAEVGAWRASGDGVRIATSRGDVEARWLVGADGLRSHVRERAGFALWRGPERFGVRRHYRTRPWSDYVEVHWGEGLEAYVTPVSPDSVGVALLGADCGGGPDALLERFPALRRRLGPPDSAPRGAGPFAVIPRRRRRGRVLLVGDAAGYLDAITGEGLSLAFEGAVALVEAVAAGRPQRYEARWRAIARRHLALTRLVLALARRPALRGRALRSLARRPHVFAALLGFATGARGGLATLPALGRLAVSLLIR